jgi:catabolite regulation protein CreA
MNVNIRIAASAVVIASALLGCNLAAEEIGSVDTKFILIGPDHKIVVEAFDDPSVKGVACYVSRARTGGLKGAVGLAKDPSRFSVACRKVGPISFAKKKFSKRAHRLFSNMFVSCAWLMRNAIRSLI